MSHSTLNPQYFSHPLDLEILRRHTQWLETIAATEPIASLMKKDDRRIHSEKPVYNLERAKQIVAERFIFGHHVTSTCSMLPDKLAAAHCVSHRL
jgi:hypothetical protein